MKLSFGRIFKKIVQVLLLTAILAAVSLQASILPVNAADTNIDIEIYWDNGGKSCTISSEGTIDLTTFPSTMANLYLRISGSEARVSIKGGGRTYQNLAIVIDKGASVTLNKVSIDNSNFENNAPVTVNDNANNLLMFSGENTLTGGLARPGIAVLTDDSGSSSITIDKSDPSMSDQSCILNANGGNGAAGIGGMQNKNCGSITIRGGTVKATGSGEIDKNSAAGIGGGSLGNGGTVTICGGIVTALGANGGAGIGGGGNIFNNMANAGVGGDVTITGGKVLAIGSELIATSYTNHVGSAGIGGGARGYIKGADGGNVTISGGEVTAIGKSGGAGIGGGCLADGGNVTISGGIVNAIGEKNGAGIGGGGPEFMLPGGKGGCVSITGGTVEAKSNGGYDLGGAKGAEGSKNYFSGGSIKVENINCAPVVSSTDNTPVDRNLITIPDISAVTEVRYTVDGGATKYASTDSLGKLYLWLPRATGEIVYNLSVTVLADPSKTYSIKTDPIVNKWGKAETYTVTDSRTIDLANFSSTPDAGNLTIAASGSTADVKIVGDANVTYKNLRIYIDKGAHVTLYRVNIDNTSCSADYSPVEAGDSNTGNTLYTMELNNLTGSKDMPGVFVAEGKNLNIYRSSDPMAGTARLLANGGTDAAGIGGKNGGGAGSISINNGSILATGNGGGSGIGGGNNGAGGTMSVVNAIVTAQKGSSATYDIGGGQGAAGGKSYITSGVVFASGISNTPEVSTSDSTPLGKKSLKLGDTSTNISYVKIDNNYNYGNIKTDSNGYLNLYFTKGTHSVFYYDGSKLFITSDSSSDYLTVTRLNSFSNTGYLADSSGNINISESGTYLVSGNTTLFKSSIKVAQGINVNITLDNVKLSSNTSGLSLDSNTTVNLTIKGTNTLSGGAGSPGITVPNTSTFNIEGTDTDSLSIDGNGSAGIYNSGTVSIKGGKITANGGASGAGIGGSYNDASGHITISGGTVAVTGGNGAAGIGGGENGAGGTVTITGGMIKAVKGTGAPFDIGSGKGTGLAGGTNTFTGGSINVGSISSMPTDGTAPVYLTTVDVIDNSGQTLLDTKVSFTMPNGVTFDTTTDSLGKLYPWLPTSNNATVTISSGGKNYNATGDVTSAGPNNMTTASTVDSVAVIPATATVQKGNTQNFNAVVTGTNTPAQTVTWSVIGGVAGTSIDNAGVLTVAVDETASTLTVTATSTVDNTQSGTASVTVTEAPPPAPTVDSVTVTPATATVQKGKTQTFSAAVTGTNNPVQTVAWSVTGGVAGTSIDNAGVLTVAVDETATTLIVTATSTVDNAKSGTAAVTVTEVPPPAPIVDSVTVTPATATFAAQTAGYLPVTAQSITVTKTGTGDITNLAVTLSGTNAGSFTLGTLGTTTLDSTTTSAAFSIKPNDGLSAGTYIATVTITADHGISQSFDVSFTVNATATTTYYTVSVGNFTDGSITASPLMAVAGTSINLTVTPNVGMRLKAGMLKYNDGTEHVINATSFTMPSANVTVTAEFEVIPPINTAAIAGVTTPITGATPVATIADTTEYTATISWSPTGGTFAQSTIYTATITITPKAGYTLTGVAANFFKVAGATTTYSAGTGIVTAVFPATAAPYVPPYTPSWYSVTGVSLDKTSLSLSVGEEPSSLTASVQPNYASYPAVTWSSSDPTVASVNGGVVTPLISGKTTITVTTSDGGKTASCIVLVTPSPGKNTEWDERQAAQSVAQDKTWRVRFSKAVGPESINRQNIMVLDSNNEPVEIDVKADAENDKIILVTPKDSYKKGEHYRLYLGAGLDSSTGKSLSKGIMFRFTVE